MNPETEKLLSVFRSQATTQPESVGGNVPAEDPFITSLKETLSSQAGIISSRDAVGAIRAAQDTIRSGADASADAITSEYTRAKGYQSEQNNRAITAARESQRGFAVNQAMLEQISETGKRAIDDLEMRRLELIRTGEAEAASAIAALQVKEADMMVANRQQAFQNMLAIGGFAIQVENANNQKEQLRQSAYQFDRQMQMSLGSIALEFGVDLKPGDTVESVIQKARPNADKMAQYRLDEMALGLQLKKVQIAREKAEIGRIGRESESAGVLAKALSIFGVNSDIGQGILESSLKSGNIGEVANLLNTLSQPRNYSDDDLRQKTIFAYSSGVSIGDLIESIKSDSSIQNKGRAEEIARLYYNSPKVESGISLFLKEAFSNPSTLGYGWSPTTNNNK